MSGPGAARPGDRRPGHQQPERERGPGLSGRRLADRRAVRLGLPGRLLRPARVHREHGAGGPTWRSRPSPPSRRPAGPRPSSRRRRRSARASSTPLPRSRTRSSRGWPRRGTSTRSSTASTTRRWRRRPPPRSRPPVPSVAARRSRLLRPERQRRGRPAGRLLDDGTPYQYGGSSPRPASTARASRCGRGRTRACTSRIRQPRSTLRSPGRPIGSAAGRPGVLLQPHLPRGDLRGRRQHDPLAADRQRRLGGPHLLGQLRRRRPPG